MNHIQPVRVRLNGGSDGGGAVKSPRQLPVLVVQTLFDSPPEEHRMHEKREEQVFVTGIDINLSQPAAPPPMNWHRADILCAIRKAGSNLSELSRKSGLAPSTLSNALYRSWPKGEKIIADFLGKDVAEIWPERYR